MEYLQIQITAMVKLLDEKFGGNPMPSILAVAKYLHRSPESLKSEPRFYKLTTGNVKRYISLPNLALYMVQTKGVG